MSNDEQQEARRAETADQIRDRLLPGTMAYAEAEGLSIRGAVQAALRFGVNAGMQAAKAEPRLETIAAEVVALERERDAALTRAYGAEREMQMRELHHFESEARVAELQAVIERVRRRGEIHGPYNWLDATLSTSGAEALEAAKRDAWDECLDAIEKHDLNTEQARSGNPYCETGEQSNG